MRRPPRPKGPARPATTAQRQWWRTGICPPKTTRRGKAPPQALQQVVSKPPLSWTEQQRRWRGYAAQYTVYCAKRDGRRHGWETVWRPSSEELTHYVEGKRRGPHTRWGYDGSVASESYWDELRHGMAGRWKSGILVEEWRYVLDALDGKQRSFYPDGTRREVRTMRKGLSHGPQEGWHPNGKRQYRHRYREGTPVGPLVYWHANGRRHRTHRFERGKMHGKTRVYDSAGKLVGIWIFRHGKRMPTDNP